MSKPYSSADTFWLVPNQVILSVPSYAMTSKDMSQQNEDIRQLIQAGAAHGQKVHVCIDASYSRSLPSPLEAMTTLTFPQEPALGLSALGGVNNPIITFFARFMGKVVKTKIEIFGTPELALQYLMRHDSTLPNLIPLYHETMKTREF